MVEEIEVRKKPQPIAKRGIFPKTSAREIEAFELYFAMGKKRNLRAIASHFDVTTKTVRDWSSRGKWRDRVLLRDKKLGVEIARDTDQAIRDARKYLLEFAAIGAQQALNRISEGTLKIESAADVDRLTSMIQRLTGGAIISGLEESVRKLIEEANRRGGSKPPGAQ